MIAFISVFAKVIALTLSVVSFAFLLRAILPLFTSPEDSRIYLFACLVTEPFIIPVRFLLNKFHLFEGTPIDWSFMISYLLLAMIRTLLPVI